MVEYTRRFIELTHFAPAILIDEGQRTRKFQWGLRPAIQDAPAVLELKTYDEVFTKVEIVESRLKDLFFGVCSSRSPVPLRRQISRYSSQDKRPGMVTDVSPRPPSTSGRALTCRTCGKNHGNQSCPCVTRSCFKCGSQQHLIRNCPLMKEQVEAQRRG